MASDIQYKLRHVIRGRFLRALNGRYKRGSAIALLGCTIDQFVKHIERQFSKGMNWSNMGKGADKWNIDHATPMSSFDLTDRDQLAIACNYKNMQPMWQVDNFKKKASHPVDFARSRGLLL